MRMRYVAALLAIPLLLLPLLARAQLYRWVDDSGKVHYSDQVPPSDAKNVKKQARAAGQGTAALPYALQQSVKSFPVTLYASDACKETCAQARELLDKRGVPYSEVTVTDEVDLAKLKQLSGGHMVPVMTVGREVYKGFEAGIYKTALDSAGYPPSSLLPPGVPARTPVAKPARKPAAAPAPGDAEATAVTTPPETATAPAPR